MEKAARVRNTLAFRDSRRKDNPDLHSQADAADDVLQLLTKAERKGLPPQRAAIIRSQANTYPGLPPSRVRKIESALRAWIRRREM